MAEPIIFYHAPNSRSSGTLTLLEELGAPYRIHALNLPAGEQRQPAYLAVNPMGKVPAIMHGDALVTEQPAIFTYLADLFPEAGLAPAIGDRLRGPYLRWFAFYGGCFEPALVDKAMGHAPSQAAMSPYGDYGTVMETLTAQLRAGTFLLGDRLTALDILWAGALRWTVMFKLVPESPEVMGYVERVTSRPAFAKAAAIDVKLAAEQAPPAA